MFDKTILVYNDKGVSQTSAEQWIERCEEWGVFYSTVCAYDIKNGALNNADIFIIPGGADMPYCEKLSGLGTDNIKKFVNNGGIYIGCCAGAYFAHRDIEWNNNGEIISGNRDLQFFNGTAYGPLEKPYNPETTQGLIYVPVFYKNDNKIKAMSYYKGGPVMIVDSETTVIAKFVYKGESYPAIMLKKIGNGTAVGMCPHMEFNDDYLNSINAPHCENRNNMFLDIFENILFNK